MDPLIGRFLEESPYIDYRSPLIRSAATQLFEDGRPAVERAETAYVFVRDEIPHSFDCRSGIVTAKASDVLRHRTGICHAKANLLAALLRSQGIPTGFCYQHITLADDDSLGYCVHAFNAVYLDGHWIRLDARGNTGGIDARFSLDKPVLAFRTGRHTTNISGTASTPVLTRRPWRYWRRRKHWTRYSGDSRRRLHSFRI